MIWYSYTVLEYLDEVWYRWEGFVVMLLQQCSVQLGARNGWLSRGLAGSGPVGDAIHAGTRRDETRRDGTMIRNDGGLQTPLLPQRRFHSCPHEADEIAINMSFVVPSVQRCFGTNLLPMFPKHTELTNRTLAIQVATPTDSWLNNPKTRSSAAGTMPVAF